MLNNEIIHDFGNEGLCINIGTKLYPNRKILIDQDVYYNNFGRISARGDRALMVIPNKDNIYLARFIMDVYDPKLKVIHKDRLLVDYRRSNLIVSEKSNLRQNSIYSNTLHDFKLSYCKKLLESGEIVEIVDENIDMIDNDYLWYQGLTPIN